MKIEERDALLRTLILGTLVEHSGKQLLPDLIGELTKQLVERCVEVIERFDYE